MKRLPLRVNSLSGMARRTFGAVAVVLVAASVGWATPAEAHDALVWSDPPEAGVVEALPSRAVLTFTGEVGEVHEISVKGPDGSVTNGEATFEGREVRQNLWAGPDGAYVLTYHVVSSDGHDVRGEIHFDVKPVSTAGAGDPDRTGAVGTGHGLGEGGRGVILAAALLVLAVVAALGFLRRTRRGRS